MLLTEDGSFQQEDCCNFSKFYRAVIKKKKKLHASQKEAGREKTAKSLVSLPL